MCHLPTGDSFISEMTGLAMSLRGRGPIYRHEEVVILQDTKYKNVKCKILTLLIITTHHCCSSEWHLFFVKRLLRRRYPSAPLPPRKDREEYAQNDSLNRVTRRQVTPKSQYKEIASSPHLRYHTSPSSQCQ
jgi:hypothetical protein